MRFEEYRQYDAVALAGLVGKGEVSAGELLDLAIARAEAVNPKINAIVHRQYEQPLADRGAGLLILLVHDRIDFGIDGFRTSNRRIQQFTGTDIALADQTSERDRVEAAYSSNRMSFYSTRETKPM